MKILLLVSIILSSIIYSNAQNLVINNSYEDAWSCPETFTTLPVAKPFPAWLNPNKGTPDQLHVCSIGDSGVPENFAGFIYPADGAAYAGIILREIFDDSVAMYEGVSREYIQTKLKTPLVKNKTYCVKLYYANSSKSFFAVDALGITITSNQIGTKDAGLIIQRPQIINRPGHIMDNIDYWQEMCGIYRARGNEKYLTIGNFWDNENTVYKKNKYQSTDSAFYYAYYYIDDVRVFEIENAFECGCLNNLSFGSDWLGEDYNPQTGYNSLIADNNGNFSNDGVNDTENNTNNGNLTHNNDNNSSNLNNLNNNSDITDENASNINNQSGSESESMILLKDSEISKQAFDNVGVGSKFNLNRIFFEFNSSELITTSFRELDELSEILVLKPSLRIEIRGHTDNVGSDSYNKSLSIKRAAAVYDYLISKGIDKSRMKYRGFGNKVPLSDEDTEEGRSQNRRVEIIIVGL
ncbi:MAG: OmpA family protein [Bacteroidales bacterium]|nr:OmpA family protein [Bacteroidales bacterium]MDD3858892.1 OmpA family protein [Bacteroidales bacterium]